MCTLAIVHETMMMPLYLQNITHTQILQTGAGCFTSCLTSLHHNKLKLTGKATPQPDSSTPAPTTRAIMLAMVASLELTASDALLETAPATRCLVELLATVGHELRHAALKIRDV